MVSLVLRRTDQYPVPRCPNGIQGSSYVSRGEFPTATRYRSLSDISEGRIHEPEHCSGDCAGLYCPGRKVFMTVYVIGSTGKPLMPTSPAKARHLLRDGKAMVYRKVPFTIRLTYQTGGATQNAVRGWDTGEQHIGFSVVRDNGVVLDKAEITLRKSMDKRKLMETRAAFRRNRRYRKVRYRHPKFRLHTVRKYMYDEKKHKYRFMKVKADHFSSDRPEGWLPPSIQSKVDHHIHWINVMREITPSKWYDRIEVARFDVQHMKDPTIHNELYQQGRMYGYENVKAYVLAKFNYTCPICGHKFDHEHRPKMHHVTFKSHGATDNPDEFAPICEKCHTPENHKNGAVLDKLRKACMRKEYREPAFMNILRKRLYKAFPDAVFTYGNITNADRKALGLCKTHANDALAVAAGNKFKTIRDIRSTTSYVQVRRKKRSLHEANPRKGSKVPNRLAKRNNKNVKSSGGLCINDKVRINGRIGWINSFTGGGVRAVDSTGKYITVSDKYSQTSFKNVKYLHHTGHWRISA